jgi:ribonuclease P/MRP protein subunit RPP40
VVVCGSYSSEADVDSGVPQGTVLGPGLFTIFIDNLEVEVEISDLSTFIVRFADDTKGLHVIESEEDRDKMQRSLDLLVRWADEWGMVFNVDNCKVMHVGRHNPMYEYYMKGRKLATTEEEKDVGVYVTKNLKPCTQCHRAATRAKAVLNQLRKYFHYWDRKTFIKLYKQYARPHLEFASPAWSPWNAGDQEELERVQQKAIKMVTGLKRETYEENVKSLAWKLYKRGGYSRTSC